MFFITLTSSKFPFIALSKMHWQWVLYIIIRVSTYIKEEKSYQSTLSMLTSFRSCIHLFIYSNTSLTFLLCTKRCAQCQGNKVKGVILILRSILPCEGRRVSKWIAARHCDKKHEKSDCSGNYQSKLHCSFLLNKKISFDWRNKCKMVTYSNSSHSFIKQVCGQGGAVVSSFGCGVS